MTDAAPKPGSPLASATEILTANRMAIARVLAAADSRTEPRSEESDVSSNPPPNPHDLRDGIAATLFSAAEGVWAGHPARTAFDLTIPVVKRAIRRRPGASVAIAAGLGAAVVLIPNVRRQLLMLGRKAALGSISTAALVSTAWGLLSGHSSRPPEN